MASLAVLVAAPAHAADIWTDVPVTPAYLGACAVAGAFVLPGTGGCLRISGSVASEFGTSLPSWQGSVSRAAGPDRPSTAADFTRPATQARVAADVRIPTDLGPLRAYVSIRNRRAF